MSPGGGVAVRRDRSFRRDRKECVLRGTIVSLLASVVVGCYRGLGGRDLLPGTRVAGRRDGRWVVPRVGN